MDLNKDLDKNKAILLLQNINGNMLAVKENLSYRWLEYGDENPQSVMKKTLPDQIVSPVCEALVLFLLLDKKSINVLSLGLGGASVERYLATIPNLFLTSIEASQSIIEIAQRFFYLPKKIQLICQRAEQFIEQTDQQYDVVLCDLFIARNNPNFIFTGDFYAQLEKITSQNGVVMVNLQADTEQQLLKVLFVIRKYFSYVALFEFDDYSNIVIMCCLHKIPEKTVLQARLVDFPQLSFESLHKIIENMYIIPHR